MQQQENIYRVRRIGDANPTVYIAKQLRPDANELEILLSLREEEHRCENIIQLIDIIDSSVGQCIILPQLRCVANELFRFEHGGALHGRYIALSRDVAKGVSFLHDHGIAHLDIKPANMVYTENYRLQLIDFDTSVRVKSEDETIEGYIGSEEWIAPEIGPEDGPNYPYSPIKADRYSCGRVFMDFLLAHEGDDEGLRQFATELLHENPNERPQLRKWCGEDDGTVSEGKTSVAEESMAELALTEKSSVRPLKRKYVGWDSE